MFAFLLVSMCRAWRLLLYWSFVFMRCRSQGIGGHIQRALRNFQMSWGLEDRFLQFEERFREKLSQFTIPMCDGKGIQISSLSLAGQLYAQKKTGFLSKLHQGITSMLREEAGGLLGPSLEGAQEFCKAAKEYCLHVMTWHIEDSLRQLPQQAAWTHIEEVSKSGFTAPGFSLAPQEYITQAGDALLSLPAHLDTLSSHTDVDSPLSGLHWMNLVAQQTCKSLLTNVKEVSLLSPFGSKQLSSDIREWEQSSTPHLVFPVLFKT